MILCVAIYFVFRVSFTTGLINGVKTETCTNRIDFCTTNVELKDHKDPAVNPNTSDVHPSYRQERDAGMWLLPRLGLLFNKWRQAGNELPIPKHHLVDQYNEQYVPMKEKAPERKITLMQLEKEMEESMRKQFKENEMKKGLPVVIIQMKTHTKYPSVLKRDVAVSQGSVSEADKKQIKLLTENLRLDKSPNRKKILNGAKAVDKYQAAMEAYFRAVLKGWDANQASGFLPIPLEHSTPINPFFLRRPQSFPLQKDSR